MHSNRYTEIIQRSENGPYMKEADFERVVVQRVQELVRKYGVEVRPPDADTRR